MHIELKADKFVALGKVSPGGGNMRNHLQLVEFVLCLLAYLYKIDFVFECISLCKSFYVRWGSDDVYLFHEKLRVLLDGLRTEVLLIELLILHENDELRARRQVVFLLL